MGNEKLFTLIKSPIITEQTALLGENLKQVVFKVDLSANKREIKQAVEKLFNVEVLKVTTSVVKGKTKRNRFGVYKKSNYKKAFVSISEDSEIQFEGIN
jgi:large subunit ribosomal protein L23